MHICFTVSAMNSGGAERVVSVLSNKFVCQGHEVTIVMVSQTKTESFYYLEKRIRLIALCDGYKKTTKPLKRTKLLTKTLQNLKPDIVIAFLPHICIYSYLSLRHSKIPLIVSERNDPHQYSGIYKIVLKHVFKNADGCVFQTHDAMSWYLKSKKKDNSTIIYNPICISNELVKNNDREKVVLFVGSNSDAKNVPMMLKAYDIFYQKHSDYILKIYGANHSNSYIEQFVSSEVAKSIFVMGKQNNWQEKEANAHFYLSSSNYEGMSNSLAESAALGITCVATDCPIGGSKELSNHFKNISLVSVNDYSDMAKKMEDHFLDPVLEKAGVPDVFMVDNIAKQWLLLIKNILTKHKL